MSGIKWFKVAVDMFEDTKIDYISGLPEGDAIIVIWIRMMSLAANSNFGGYLMVSEGIPYDEASLCRKFKRDPIIFRFALETLLRFKLINLDDGPYHITNWDKHQNVEGMDKVRLDTAKRVAKHREKKKNQLLLEECNVTVTLPSNASVTQCNATEEEVRIRTKSKKKNTNKDIVELKPDDVPYSEIIDYLNEKAETSYRSSTAKTKQLIQARWNEKFSIDQFKTVIDKKCAEWKNDPNMCNYLRPETLFGTKFESYLNQKIVLDGGNSQPKNKKTEREDDIFKKFLEGGNTNGKASGH